MSQFRTLQRGDAFKIGKTQWLVFRRDDEVTAYVYKHPSKHAKLYQAVGVSDDDIEVYEVGGSGQRISDTLARGAISNVQRNAERMD